MTGARHACISNSRHATSEKQSAPDAIRTRDTRFRRAVLYPLSYQATNDHYTTRRTVFDTANRFQAKSSHRTMPLVTRIG